MKPIVLSKQVNAPPEVVFAAASDFANCAGRITGIAKVEMLTPGPVGVGTRFKETRVMFGKEATEEMTVSAFDPPRGYELTALSCGAEYRSVFRFEPVDGGTRIDLTIHTRAVSFMAKMMTPLAWMMKGMLTKCVAKDLDDLRQTLEPTAAARS